MSPVYYHLDRFPPATLDWERLIPLIGPANAGLARYDGSLSAIPNANVLLSPLTTQEAVLSSKIEGTVVTMGEVLEIEAGADLPKFTQSKRDDAVEVLNYRSALRACTAALQERTITQHMIRGAHEMLMQGVRGSDKSPGRYRDQQNWVGSPGCTIEQANFVPVGPELVQSSMDAWETYLNRTDVPDVLIQLAILHVEFEAIHPFEDGNGRLGRMLVPLYLYQRGLLKSPDFYVSGYLEANRDQYLERLREVSRARDWTGWCIFFLEGVRQQAAENESKARRILELYESVKNRVIELTRSQHAIRVVDFMFQNPIFSGPDFLDQPGIPRPSAGRLLPILRENGIIQTIIESRGRRPGVFAYRDLINIAEGRVVF